MNGMWGIKQSLRGAVALAMATAFALCGAQAASAFAFAQTLASVTEVLQIVHSWGALYALVAPVPRGQDPSCSTSEPCSIERLQTPQLKLEKWLPQSPFA